MAKVTAGPDLNALLAADVDFTDGAESSGTLTIGGRSLTGAFNVLVLTWNPVAGMLSEAITPRVSSGEVNVLGRERWNNEMRVAETDDFVTKFIHEHKAGAYWAVHGERTNSDKCTGLFIIGEPSGEEGDAFVTWTLPLMNASLTMPTRY